MPRTSEARPAWRFSCRATTTRPRGSKPGARERFPDPFAVTPDDSFYRWLLAPDERLGVGHRIPALWGEVHRRREDLRRAFPDPAGRDEAGFLRLVEKVLER